MCVDVDFFKHSASPPCWLGSKELELYNEELLSKPALLVVNKMDLPDAQDKLTELKEQLEQPHGKLTGFLFLCVCVCFAKDVYINTIPIQNKR